MSLHRWTSLLTDLLNVLPSRALSEWQDLSLVDENKPTVVLVSGFAASHRNLSVIRKRLVRDGFNVLVLPMDWHALSDGVRGLYVMSEKLSSLVLALRKGKCRGKHRLYLVAHSAGGLVARHYVQLLGGYHYTDGLVTLATPHRGTWISLLGLCCHLILKARCLLQMTPVSPFIRKLNAATLPVDFRFVSIYSDEDFLCPIKATRLPQGLGQQTTIENVRVQGLSHGDFLLSKKSYQLMLRYLGISDDVKSPEEAAV